MVGVQAPGEEEVEVVDEPVVVEVGLWVMW